eukprot:gene19463-21386_t
MTGILETISQQFLLPNYASAGYVFATIITLLIACKLLSKLHILFHSVSPTTTGSKYGVSELGFLPSSCLQRLPKYYNTWEEIVDELPNINKQGRIHEVIDKMPLLSCQELRSEEMLRRAFIILGMFVHSLVNGDNASWQKLTEATDSQISTNSSQRKAITRIPKQLALPWFTVCKKLDLPFVLTAGLDLWNWKLKDSSKPISFTNLTTISSMTGTDTERYFHLVPCGMQAVAGPFIPKLLRFHDLLSSKSNLDLIPFINSIKNIFNEFKVLMKEICKFVDKDVFYDVYRPLLAGFWPHGVVLDVEVLVGVFHAGERCQNVIVKDGGDNGGVRVRPKGPSAGQSTMILLFDVLLGIEHGETGKDFQSEMLDYMPFKHRKMAIDFREIVSKKGSLREIVIDSGDKDVVDAFNECIKSVVAFRMAHLGIVLSYLKRSTLGTGSSSFRIMLDEMVQHTRNAQI